MTETTQQDTFLSSAQLLERAASRCREAEKDLRKKLESVSESKRLEISNVAHQEHLLACALEGYIKHAPKKVLNTCLQYQFDSSLQKEIHSHSVDDTYEQLTQLNEDLVKSFHDQAMKAGSPSFSEAMENVSREINAVNRRISMIRITAQDL